MASRFEPFMERLEEIWCRANDLPFACSYYTAVKGAKLCGFAIPSQRHAKRLLDRDGELFASTPVRLWSWLRPVDVVAEQEAA